MWCDQCFTWVRRFSASREGTHFSPCNHGSRTGARLVFVKPICWRAGGTGDE